MCSPKFGVRITVLSSSWFLLSARSISECPLAADNPPTTFAALPRVLSALRTAKSYRSTEPVVLPFLQSII